MLLGRPQVDMGFNVIWRQQSCLLQGRKTLLALHLQCRAEQAPKKTGLRMLSRQSVQLVFQWRKVHGVEERQQSCRIDGGVKISRR